jgi:integrase
MTKHRGLSKRDIETAKDGRHFDGMGLYLEVDGKSKRWTFRYAIDGRERWHGLGAVIGDAITSRNEARERAIQCRKLLHDGIDPIEASREKRAEDKKARDRNKTFHECAEAWMKEKKEQQPGGWTPKVSLQNRRIYTRYIRPKIGDLSIQKFDHVKSDDAVLLIYDVLTQEVQKTRFSRASKVGSFWHVRTPTAMIAQQMIDGIIRWAHARRFITSGNAADLTGTLGEMLPRADEIRDIRPHPGPRPEEMPKIMATIRAPIVDRRTRNQKLVNWEQRERIAKLLAAGKRPIEIKKAIGLSWPRTSKLIKRVLNPVKEDALVDRPLSSYVLEFMILTATRAGQATFAKWDEINLDKAIWVSKKHKTRKKVKVDHYIPLSTQAIALLKMMKEKQATLGIKSELVFGGFGPLYAHKTDHYVKRHLRRKDITVHGFRTTFKTWALEYHNTPTAEHDSEMVLAHKIGDAVRNIYGRLIRRENPQRVMLQAWADFCDHGPQVADVIPFQQKVSGDSQ